MFNILTKRWLSVEPVSRVAGGTSFTRFHFCFSNKLSLTRGAVDCTKSVDSIDRGEIGGDAAVRMSITACSLQVRQDGRRERGWNVVAELNIDVLLPWNPV